MSARAVIIIPDPGGGFLALTPEALAEARLWAAEVLGSYSGPTPAAAPKEEPPVRSEPRWLDAAGIAAATGTKASWWEAAALAGTVPSAKAGRARRFELSECMEYLRVRKAAKANKVPTKRRIGPRVTRWC